MSGLAQRRAARRGGPRAFPVAPGVARGVVVAALVVGVVAGWGLTRTGAAELAVAAAGPELTRLLRAMAGIKLLLAAGAAAAVWWRLGMGVGRGWLAGYAVAGAAMAAGPGLIWQMAHAGAGALLLHGGLAATVVLLWRDPGTVARLEMTMRRRGSRRWVGRV